METLKGHMMRVTVSKVGILVQNNDLSPVRHQATEVTYCQLDIKGPHKENSRSLNQLFPCHIYTMN